MMKKYKHTRVTAEAHKHFVLKQKKMMEMYQRLTGKNKVIPLSEVVEVTAKEPVFFNDGKLVRLFGKRRLRKI